jgi:hypothetical protein
MTLITLLKLQLPFLVRKVQSSQGNVKMPLKKKGRSSTRDFIREAKSLHYAWVKQEQCRGLPLVPTNTFSLGYENVEVNA